MLVAFVEDICNEHKLYLTIYAVNSIDLIAPRTLVTKKIKL